MKRLACVVLCAVLIAALAAGAVAADKVTLVLSGWQASPEEQQLVADALKVFAQKHPNIEVKYEPIVEDFATKIKTMLAARNAPDVFYVDIFWAEPLMSRGMLLALDPYMAKTGTKRSDFAETLLNGFTYNGKTYGIPKDFNTLGLFYNKKMFDEAKIPYPTPDWTWETLREVAKKLTKIVGDPSKDRYGICLPVDAARFRPFLVQSGAQFLDKTGKKCLFASPEGVRALDYYTSFKMKDKSAVIPSEVGAGWGGDAFGKERVAMVLEGGWLIPYLDNNFANVEYGVCELPKGPAGRGNVYFTVSYSVAASCKHPEEAWLLVEHLTGYENQKKVLETGFALPTRVALGDHPFFKSNPNMAAIFKGYAYAVPWQFGEHGEKIMNVLNQSIEKIYLKNEQPDKAMNDAVREIDGILSE
ncbi:MAG: ABC transporter substrate-binding protein [Firmicutes bacterium]|jgi:multiple sugar transport system substrate-binding protein|nr:ABC transporter substrate-binding protein [Bacillota bacterium]MDH7495198.1 ABC transporter substrate-binding protein [Bacillota bacterium]